MFGDTIHLGLSVSELKPHPEKPRGTVLFDYQVLKQDQVVAIEGEWRWLFASRV